MQLELEKVKLKEGNLDSYKRCSKHQKRKKIKEENYGGLISN